MTDRSVEGRYCRVKTKFWTDEKVRNWSDDAKLLALYLLSSPHANMIGCYVLPKLYTCEDLGWSLQRFAKAFEELLRDGFARYDENARLVLLPNYLKHNPIENENQAKAAAKAVAELPRSPLLQDLKQLIEQLDKPFLEPLREQIGKHAHAHAHAHATAHAYKNKSMGLSNDKPMSNEAKTSLDDAPISNDDDKEIASITDQVQQVMNHYNNVFRDLWARRLKLTKERREKIRARLKTFTVDELCRAIENLRASPFHCGENDKGIVYATPEFLFRNDSQVDKWLNAQPRAPNLPRAFASLRQLEHEIDMREREANDHGEGDGGKAPG